MPLSMADQMRKTARGRAPVQRVHLEVEVGDDDVEAAVAIVVAARRSPCPPGACPPAATAAPSPSAPSRGTAACRARRNRKFGMLLSLATNTSGSRSPS